MSLGTLRDLEQGRIARPRWATVQRVAAVLDIDLAQRPVLSQAADGATATGRDEPAPVWIGILGPASVRVTGVTVPLGSLRQQTVLGLLAMHTEAGIHRDAIIDVLWGAAPPASAPTQVHGYVSRLRRLLATGGGHGGTAQNGNRARRHGAGDLVVTAGAVYRLQPRTDQLDLAAFRLLMERARRTDTHGQSVSACELYELALSLWRGDVLAGLDLLRGYPVAVEVTHRRSDAVLGYVGAAARAGVPYRALPELRELCTRECFNEAAHAHLMVALATSGQQAAALEVFSQLRHRLVSELGISPGPQLTAAHACVLHQGTSGYRWSADR